TALVAFAAFAAGRARDSSSIRLWAGRKPPRQRSHRPHNPCAISRCPRSARLQAFPKLCSRSDARRASPLRLWLYRTDPLPAHLSSSFFEPRQERRRGTTASFQAAKIRQDAEFCRRKCPSKEFSFVLSYEGRE